MLGLRQVEVLRAFMRTGTVKGAAELLNVSQPGVSKTLRHVEETLGVHLFVRGRGRLKPTTELKVLAAEIENAWISIDRVKRTADNLRLGIPGHLRIGTTPSTGAYLILRAVVAFQRKRKNTTFSIEVAAPDDMTEKLSTGQLDVAYTLFPVDHPGLTVERLASTAMVCVMPADHPLAAAKTVGPQDLARCPFVSFPRDTAEGRLIAAALSAQGQDVLIDISVRSTAAACWFVQAGAGIALVDGYSMNGNAFPGLIQRPFSAELQLDLNVCTSTLRATSDAVAAMNQTLLALLL